MENRRFDDFARSLAGQGSRRGILRGLAGGAVAALVTVVAGRQAQAQQATVGTGGECASSSQCAQDPFDLAVICADNGITTDGALNCCRNEGGGCAGGSGCCGALLCLDGVCTSAGAAPTGEGLAPGAQCSFAGECDQTGGETDCADNGIGTDGAFNCCRYDGGSCATSDACCGGLLCVGGVCTDADSPASGGFAPGEICTSTSQCSQVGGPTVCANNGIAADGALNCCRTAGGACTAANFSAGCCGGLLCVDGTCQ